jgi:uncharacterized protein (UPF0332 family)
VNLEELERSLRDCFKAAEKDEERGRKHKGLLPVEPNHKTAEEYIQKAKMELELCEIYRQKGVDYKIAEEWFYALYYCALAILSKFGVETRSQRYTALFLRYVKNKKLIDYEDDFINRITVYSGKDDKSEVDEREESRYSSSIKSERVKERYAEMTMLCKKAISQAEEITFSDKIIEVPNELLK